MPERVAWAVDLLDVQPGDRILELGCGPGVAAALVCERLAAGGGAGRMTAIDRSPVAVARTRTRNAACLDAGRLTVEHVELARFEAGPETFDKAFALNVNAFWTGAADRELAVLSRVLRRGGVVHLVYGAPEPGGTPSLEMKVAANLEHHWFVPEVRHHPGGALIDISGQLLG